MQYQKINTLYKRDTNNLIMIGNYASKEFELLKDLKWEATEKVDGTNIRIMLVPHVMEDSTIEYQLEFRGKTDKANIPQLLMEHLKTKYTKELVASALNVELAPNDVLVEDLPTYIIYGEGYGVKIQSCGGRYIQKSNSFIVFDVKIGNMWLKREDVEDIANKLGAPIVPIIGYYTIKEAEALVTEGFNSHVAEDETLIAEGVVMRCPMGLLNRRGERLICKIKYCDYHKLKLAKDKAAAEGKEFVQIENPKLNNKE